MVLQLQSNTVSTRNNPKTMSCDPIYRFYCYQCRALICLQHVCTPDTLTELRFVALWPRCLDASVPLILEKDMLCWRCFDRLYPGALIAGLGQREAVPEHCEVFI